MFFSESSKKNGGKKRSASNLKRDRESLMRECPDFLFCSFACSERKRNWCKRFADKIQAKKDSVRKCRYKFDILNETFVLEIFTELFL